MQTSLGSSPQTTNGKIRQFKNNPQHNGFIPKWRRHLSFGFIKSNKIPCFLALSVEITSFASLFHPVDFLHQQLNVATELLDPVPVGFVLTPLFFFRPLPDKHHPISCCHHYILVFLGKICIIKKFSGLLFWDHLYWVGGAARNQGSSNCRERPRQWKCFALTAWNLSSGVWLHSQAVRQAGLPAGKQKVSWHGEKAWMDEGRHPSWQRDKAGLQMKDGFHSTPLSPDLSLISYLGGLPHGQASQQVHQDNHYEEEEEQEDEITKNRAGVETDVWEFQLPCEHGKYFHNWEFWALKGVFAIVAFAWAE